jgi:hypothetical protein
MALVVKGLAKVSICNVYIPRVRQRTWLWKTVALCCLIIKQKNVNDLPEYERMFIEVRLCWFLDINLEKLYYFQTKFL